MNKTQTVSENYKRMLVVILFILLSITQAATDIYIPALPNMAKEFGASPYKINMTITYYVYAQAILFLFMGKISDFLGRKKTIITSVLIALICTVLIAESNNLNYIIVLRIFQAFGSAGVYIVSRLILKEVSDNDELLKLTALIMLALVLSPALAPILGAFILKYFNWRWIFRFLAIFLAIFWLISIVVLKESNQNIEYYRQNFSLIKFINGYLVVLKEWLFIRYVLIVGGTFASFYAFITMSSYMYIQEYHFSETHYSYLFTIIAFGYFMGNKIMTYLTNKKYSTYFIVKIGIVIGIIVCVLSLLSYFLTAQVTLFIILVTLCGWMTRLATALINPPIQVIVLNAFPEHSSYAVGLISSLQYVFAAMGSWSVGILGLVPSISILATTIGYTLLSVVFFMLIKPKDLK